MMTAMSEPTDTHSIFNIASHLSAMARRQPYQRAVVFPHSRSRSGRVAYTHLTFRQLEKESDCLAHGLASVGITRGTRTIVMVRPGLDFFALTFALFKTGAVPVMVDPGMGVRRMVDCFRQSRPEAFIGIPLAHVLRVVYPRFFNTVNCWVTVGRRWFWGGHRMSQLRKLPWTPFPLAETRRDETAAILFTTGSTGPAKGVVYTHGIFDAQIRHIRTHFGIEPGEIDLPTFPLFALFDPALGMTAVIPDMDPTKPAHVNPLRIIEAISNHGVTNMFASPALLNRVGTYCQSRGMKFPSLKRVVSAGAPVSPANIAQFSDLLDGDAQVHTPYGATEAVPFLSIGSDEILNQTRQLSEQGYGMCVGTPINGQSVRIIRISDEPIGQWRDRLLVEDGEIGEIIVSSDLSTRSYFENPVADALHKISEGEAVWHRMGDLGWRDNKGRIWFCGRKSHRVQTPDGTLYTIPCEAIFNNHPKVYRSALVGIGPAPEQTPAICIELNPEDDSADRQQLSEELLAMARENEQTRHIETILFHKSFPVDIRHNSKIFREKLAVWAAGKLPAAQAVEMDETTGNPGGTALDDSGTSERDTS
jgi:acyl-CoA synthetase (AMP-forming)/AMP-acid ligase II